MQRYLLDTSVLIPLLRGNEAITVVVSGLIGEICTSYVCISELYEGVNRVNDKKSAEKGILDLCSGVSEIYGLDLEIAKRFGQIKTVLWAKGEIVDDLDILIAATCLVQNLGLLTLNTKHFSRIPGLEIVSTLHN